MKRKINSIEGVFRDKLIDYSQPAPDDVWKNIEQQLNANKSRFIGFYKIAAAVVAIVALGSVYFYNLNNEAVNINAVAENKKIESPEKNIITHITQVPEENKGTKNAEYQINDVNKPQGNTEKIERKKEVVPNLIVENTSEIRQDEALAKMESQMIAIHTKNLDPQIITFKQIEIVPDLNSLPDIYTNFAYNEPIEEEKKVEDKWIIGGEFTPLYSYRYLSAGSDKEYYNNVESPVMSYTGGVNVQYKAFDRLTIQSGVYYSTMGQTIDQMSVYSNEAYNTMANENSIRFVNNYLLQNSTGDISFNSPYVFIDERLSRVDNLNDYKVSADVSDPMFNGLNAEIQQNFRYIEVPVIIRYKLIDKRIDLNVLGGVGANFLIGNNVFLIYDNKKEVIGETSGVNNVNYNGCIGFGIDYPLTKKINIRLEPSVKYYLNAINSNSSVESHPYSFGIYTGFNYSF